MLRIGDSSPWGTIEEKYTLGGSMVYVRTKEHGGVYVPPELNAQIPDELREEDGWYEEDVAQAIPRYFLAEHLPEDIRIDREKVFGIMKGFMPDKVAHLGEPEGSL